MTDDLRLPVPVGWVRAQVPDSEVLVMMSPRGHGGEVTPAAAISRHVLAAPDAPDRDQLGRVQERLARDLLEAFEWPEIEDRDVIDVGGHHVSYLRCSHQALGHALVTDLWTWVLGEEEWSVTGTVALEDYPTYCDVFEAIADAFDPDSVRPGQAGPGQFGSGQFGSTR